MAEAKAGTENKPEDGVVIRGVKFYVDKMLSDIAGMKVLILDEETTGIVSMVYSQTQILAKEVYLVESLGAPHDRMTHLKALLYLRPTFENIQALRAELGDPKYKEYHLFFTNAVPQDMLQDLAEADVHGIVRSVQEFYGDFFAVNDDTFSLNIPNSMSLSTPRASWGAVEEYMFDRAAQGVRAALLAFKTRPHIRYQAASEVCQQFARRLDMDIGREKALFTFRGSMGPDPTATLLVLDRRDDPVTPLLTQWTYQAMVHELLGMVNNRVDMRSAPGISADLREIVLSPSQDSFYRQHMYANFGDLGSAIKDLLEVYQRKVNDNKNISNIADMQRFVESYPQFKAMSTNVSKHVALMSELSRVVGAHSLMELSVLEQELACSNDAAQHFADLTEKLRDGNVSNVDALRLVLLFALRYETSSSSNLRELKQMLVERGVGAGDVALVDALLKYAGTAKRAGDLFGNQSFAAALGRNIRRGLAGVENVYTQHKPLLSDILDAAVRGRLKETQYPAFGAGVSRERPRLLVLFVLGGITLEEAAAVAAANAANPDMTIVLGGTFVHNSKSFLAELERMAGASPAAGAGLL